MEYQEVEVIFFMPVDLPRDMFVTEDGKLKKIHWIKEFRTHTGEGLRNSKGMWDLFNARGYDMTDFDTFIAALNWYSDWIFHLDSTYLDDDSRLLTNCISAALSLIGQGAGMAEVVSSMVDDDLA